MTKTTKQPLSWLRKIDEELVNLDEIPLLKSPCAFDWEEFSESIASTLDISSIKILPSEEMLWREGKAITEGLGEDCLFLSFTASPINGDVFWIMNNSDIAKLSSKLLVKEEEKKITSPSLQEGFYRYLTLQALSLIEATKTFEGLSLKINDNPSLSNNAALCVDVTIKIGKHSCTGRLCLTPEFRKAWEEYFSQFPPIAEKGIEKKLEIPIKIQAGYTSLSLPEWEKVKVGDFILLDRGNLNPKTERGIVTLVLGNAPLFHAKIKQNRIKILDYALYEEETMDTEENNQIEEEEIEEITPVEESPTSIKEMPISIVVEVARFRITMEKLTQLQPGNFLELPISAEQGVNLTVNGKKIGRAELVHLGEALGIRIIELGK